MLVILWCVALVAAAWLYLRQVYSKFPQVKHIKPVPLLGNMARIFFRKEQMVNHIQRLYDAFPEERFIGRYEFLKPMVLIRDIELIKKIGIKDFDNFVDHGNTVNEDTDPLFGRNLFSLKGQKWKDMRSTLSPAFTSSKMRHMLPFMVEVGEQMMKSLKKKVEEGGVGYIDIDCKDLTTRYANDVIASCAFGLKVDSYTEEDNDFYAMGKKSVNLNFKRIIMFFVIMSAPVIAKILKLELFPKSTQNFFRHLVVTTMKEREEHKIVRPDMIHLLMEAKKGQLTHEEKTTDVDAGFATVEESNVGRKTIDREWTDDDIIAQAILFFFAGFETVSATMSFLLHILAFHPEVQDRLVQEIRENDAKNSGKFDYNSVLNMTYLDMVVSESLRLYPPGFLLDRVCINEYNLGKSNSKATQDYIVPKGMNIGIPVWAIHRDSRYFSDPLKFDPERFSEENKHKIHPFTYLPFGIGPRNCIGSRFALCEVKVMLYQLLLHFEISPCAKTNTTGRLEPSSFNIKLEGGHWARLATRK